MTEAIKTTQIGPVTVKILPDMCGDHECPLDTIGKDEGIQFVTFEKRSILSDCHNFSDADHAKAWAKEYKYDLFPLYKYEHGLVAYSVRSFIGRAHHAEWDSGQVGFVLIKKSIYRGAKRRAAIAESWCEAVTKWCNGEYYGYVVEDENGEHLDSCWGFDDIDYCEGEAIRIAKHHAKLVQDEKTFASLNEHGHVQ